MKWYHENNKTFNKNSENEFFIYYFQKFADEQGCEPQDFKDPLNIKKTNNTLKFDFMKRFLLNKEFKPKFYDCLEHDYAAYSKWNLRKKLKSLFKKYKRNLEEQGLQLANQQMIEELNR